jgi:hypothetical protein
MTNSHRQPAPASLLQQVAFHLRDDMIPATESSRGLLLYGETNQAVVRLQDEQYLTADLSDTPGGPVSSTISFANAPAWLVAATLRTYLGVEA